MIMTPGAIGHGVPSREHNLKGRYREHQAIGLLVRSALRDAAGLAKHPEHLQGNLKPWEVKRWYTVVNRFGYLRNPQIPRIDERRIVEVEQAIMLEYRRE